MAHASINEKKVIKELMHKELKVRQDAAALLGQEKVKKAVPALIETLKTDDPKLWPISIRALGQIKDPKATPILKKMLKKKNKFVIVEAATALGEIRGEGVPAALAAALNSVDDYGCKAIMTVIKRMRDPSSLDAILSVAIKGKSNPKCFPSSIEALGTMRSEKAAEFIMSNIDGWPDKLKITGLKSLASLKSPQSYDIAVQYFQSTNIYVKREAIGIFASLKDKRAIPILKEALNDDQAIIQSASQYALKQLGVRNP